LSKAASEVLHNDSVSLKSNDSSKFMRCLVRQQLILHDALDRLEQRLLQHHPLEAPPVNSNTTANDAMFLGLLCPVEGVRVYGTCGRNFYDTIVHVT
jgi:hypothetical protein